MDDEVKNRMVEAILDNNRHDDKIVNFDLDLDKWDVVGLFQDAIWVQRLDEPSANHIATKSGLIIPNNNRVRGQFSPIKILKVGPDVKTAKENDYALVHQQHMVHDAMKIIDGYKTYYLRESTLMSKIAYRGTEEEAKQDIEQKIS